MKYIFIILMYISSGLEINCIEVDNQRINMIVFLDGKIIETKGYFEYEDKITKLNRIPFSGTIGEMSLRKEDFFKLKELKSNDSLCLVIEHFPINKDKEVYKGEIQVPSSIFDDFAVIRITNLNKRKNKYYFGISTPSRISSFHPKEYMMFEEYEFD